MGNQTTTCLTCGRLCTPTSSDELWLHPEERDCPIRVVDKFGAPLDHAFEVEGGEIFEKEPDPEVLFSIRLFTPTEKALMAIFAEAGTPFLGGTSGTEGWSSLSLFQRCPYAWARRYLPDSFPPRTKTMMDLIDQPGMAIGTLVHVLLGVYYMKRIDASYPLTPEQVKLGCDRLSVDPALTNEAWRLFSAYRVYYKFETLKPVGVEVHLVDKKSRRSCRTDLLCIETSDQAEHPPGLYVCDHKTAQRFDDTTLMGWYNDGGIIQQADIFATSWEETEGFQKYGPLQGVIVNIIGKQKTPEFYRAYVHPSSFQVEQHRLEAPVWQAQRDLALATGIFPRARNGCITRYGKCSEWEHCVTGEP
jgi:hypothetical protein